MTGTMIVNGESLSIPIDEDEWMLNPDYQQVDFDEAYACCTNPVLPEEPVCFAQLLETIPPSSTVSPN